MLNLTLGAIIDVNLHTTIQGDYLELIIEELPL